PWLIRRNKRRTPIRVARFSDEFVFLPLRVAGNHRVFGSFKDNLIAFLADRAERPIGIHEIQPAERGVHNLPARDKIEHRIDAEIRTQDGQCDRHDIADWRWLRFLRRPLRTPHERLWQNMPQQRVIETGKEWNDGEIIQKRKVAANDEKDLKRDEQHARDVTRSARSE